jgi:ferredoxin-like protein FixX
MQTDATGDNQHGAPVLTCQECGSANVINEAEVLDHGSSTVTPLSVAVQRARPTTTKFLGVTAMRARETAEVRATLCGECGAVRLYAADARRLWQAVTGRA